MKKTDKDSHFQQTARGKKNIKTKGMEMSQNSSYSHETIPNHLHYSWLKP